MPHALSRPFTQALAHCSRSHALPGATVCLPRCPRADAAAAAAACAAWLLDEVRGIVLCRKGPPAMRASPSHGWLCALLRGRVAQGSSIQLSDAEQHTTCTFLHRLWARAFETHAPCVIHRAEGQVVLLTCQACVQSEHRSCTCPRHSTACVTHAAASICQQQATTHWPAAHHQNGHQPM